MILTVAGHRSGAFFISDGVIGDKNTGSTFELIHKNFCRGQRNVLRCGAASRGGLKRGHTISILLAAMAQSKQTKKFEAKHLKGTLKRRNEVAKIKQRNRLKDQKKARRAAEQGSDDEPTAESKAEETSAGRQKGEVRLEDMTVDEFFAGGFDVARSMGEEAGQKRSGKRKRITSGADAEDASVASVEDHAAAAGSDEDVEDNDMKLHQEELQALAKKDPEFYAYLKENDAELLEFAEDQGVDGGDPDGSGEATHGKDGKRKSKKDQSNDVSMQLVKRWASAMSEKQSLRAMRETVLAFRAAAHLNDQDDKTYKYTIKDAEGTVLRAKFF